VRRVVAWRVPVLAAIWVGVLAGPAAADPARPGDVRSQVTAVTPETDGITAEVVGGDSFLRIRVERGREVVVIGYADEPYLRVGVDGTVEVNDRSPARWLNDDRLAAVDLPAGVDPQAPPDWRVIGRDGEAAWHDHRIHRMAPGRPDPPVQEWRVPLTVDGRPVTIEGRYAYVPPAPAWPWWALAAALAGVGIVWPRSRIATSGLPVAGVLVVLVGLRLAAVPSGDAQGATAMALGAIATVLGVAGVVLRRRPPVQCAFEAAGGAALLASALPRFGVLSHSVLVTDAPAWLDRLSVSVALGVGVAAVVVGVRGVLAPRPAGEQLAPAQLGGYQPPGTSASASGGPHDPRS
jgi:hypothetical protein